MKSHTFTLYQPETWRTYPREVRERYSNWLHTQAADGADGKIFVTKELCSEVLKDDTIFAHMACPRDHLGMNQRTNTNRQFLVENVRDFSTQFRPDTPFSHLPWF